MKKNHYLIIIYKGNGSILIKLQITKGNKITQSSQTDKHHPQENPDNHSSRPGHINKDEAGKLE